MCDQEYIHEHNHGHAHDHHHDHFVIGEDSKKDLETIIAEQFDALITETEEVYEAHAHGHHHDPSEKKRQLNRLARVIGHLNHVKKMIEADEDCAEVLVQLSAAKSALNGLGKEIINEHISHCVTHAVEDKDTAALEEFQKAIQKFL